MTDKIWQAFLAKYDTVYDPTANDVAVAAQAAEEARAATMRLRFPPGDKPRSRYW